MYNLTSAQMAKAGGERGGIRQCLSFECHPLQSDGAGLGTASSRGQILESKFGFLLSV